MYVYIYYTYEYFSADGPSPPSLSACALTPPPALSQALCGDSLLSLSQGPCACNGPTPPRPIFGRPHLPTPEATPSVVTPPVLKPSVRSFSVFTVGAAEEDAAGREEEDAAGKDASATGGGEDVEISCRIECTQCMRCMRCVVSYGKLLGCS